VPFYDFRCTECGDIRKNVNFSPDALPNKNRCLECNGKVVQIIQPPGMSFIGVGWTPFAGTDRRGEPDNNRIINSMRAGRKD
jgi:putative FmdB family regulatory protein